MESAALQQNPVHLALLILEACRGFAAGASGREEALPLPLALLVAPMCLHDRAADVLLRASSFHEWRREGVGLLAEIPDRYRRLTGASLRALALLVGAHLIERVWTKQGCAFRVLPGSASPLAQTSPAIPAAEAARRVGMWSSAITPGEVLKLAGVFA